MPVLGIIASQISGHLFQPTGAYDSIATVTVGGGGSSSISFTSIPATYTHLQIRMSATINAAAGPILRFNSDTGSNYNGHLLYGDGASVGAYSYGTGTSINLSWFGQGYNSATSFGGHVIDILDYADTNKYKTVRSLQGIDRNGSGMLEFVSGLWRNTNAITSITIPAESSTFVQYSSFALYGIKGA
jgi:hypothetical protein